MDNEAYTGGSSFFFKFKVVLVVVLNLLVFAGIFMALLSLKKTRFGKHNRNYCTKDDCVQKARSMQENLDKSVHPCRHFYNFTCGNHQDPNLGLPNFRSDIYSMLFNKYVDIISNYTLNFIVPAANWRNFHNACIYLEANNKNYKKYVQTILKNFKWPPLTKNWNRVVSNTFHWLDVERELIKTGFSNSLLQFSSITMPDDKREVLSLQCTPSKITAGWSGILTENTTVNSFKQIVRSFIKIVNGEVKYADEIVQMFVQIEKIKSGSASQKSSFRDTSSLGFLPNEIITLGELDSRWKIKLTQFCSLLFPSFMNITKNTPIFLMDDCPYRLINFLNKTTKRPVAGYMLWEAARNLLWIINDETINLNLQLSLLLRNRVKQSMDWICYSFNSEFFEELWSYIYVKTYYSKARKNKVVKIVNLILDEAKSLIKNSWWSDSSKKIIHNKISNIKYVVDHDEEFLSDEYIQSTYGDLNFDTSNMINSVLKIQAHSFQRYWKVFTLNFKERPKLQMHATIINAFYFPVANSLFISAAMTMETLYSDDFEGYLNFGGIGAMISHELFHSLDVTGMQYDDKFNFFPSFWFKDQDLNLFGERFTCFVQQYSEYNLTSKFKVDGTKTLNENLADSGLILAYRAYLKWLKTNKVKKLPGFGNYNERQLFWITFGNVWCENYNQEYLEYVYYANDSHTIGKLRVLGVLSNLQEFSTDFGCPSNSFMNPENKCKLYH